MGANRGGRAVAEALFRTPGIRLDDVNVVDPKEGRSRALAATFARSGARVRAIEERCERAIIDLDPDAATVLAVDEVAPMADILEERPGQTVLGQGVARGARTPGEATPVFGLAVAGVPGREKERAEVAHLFREVARLTPPGSSTIIREEPMAAMRLHAVRQETSALTARRLATIERLPEEDNLATLLLNQVHYPLVATQRQAETRAQLTEEALSHGGKRPVAVALHAEGRVDFFVVAPAIRRDGGFVRFHTTFQRVLPPEPSSVDSGLQLPFLLNPMRIGEAIMAPLEEVATFALAGLAVGALAAASAYGDPPRFTD
ncbi:MAG: hypothetical protein ACOZNI_20205 [Myxococcota bacterium]